MGRWEESSEGSYWEGSFSPSSTKQSLAVQRKLDRNTYVLRDSNAQKKKGKVKKRKHVDKYEIPNFNLGLYWKRIAEWCRTVSADMGGFPLLRWLSLLLWCVRAHISVSWTYWDGFRSFWKGRGCLSCLCWRPIATKLRPTQMRIVDSYKKNKWVRKSGYNESTPDIRKIMNPRIGQWGVDAKYAISKSRNSESVGRNPGVF